jgi:hypothetical protein
MTYTPGSPITDAAEHYGSNSSNQKWDDSGPTKRVIPSRSNQRISTELNRYTDLLERLENSRAKNRRGSGVRRSDPAREAEQQKRQAEYSANQNRYRGDFEIKGGPGQAYKSVVTGYYNPETGATWSAPHSGYTPKEGTGWVKGYGPSFSSPKSAPISPNLSQPTVSTNNKGKDFEAMLRARMSKF